MSLAFAILAVFNLSSLSTALRPPWHDDLALYYAAAQTGWAHGWSSIYRLELMRPAIHALGGDATYLEPPLLAWLVSPLLALPYPAALVVWTAILAGCAALAIAVGTTGLPGWRRTAAILGGAGFAPLGIALLWGEATLLVWAAIAAGGFAIRRGRPFLGGLLLAGVGFKPHLAVLVPLLVLASGEWRAGLAALGALAALALASAVAIGAGGIRLYLAAIAFNFANHGAYLHFGTLTGTLGVGAGVVASVMTVAAAAIAARRVGRRDPEIVVALGVAASLMITTYVVSYDFVLLLPAGWALARYARGVLTWAGLGAAYWAVELSNLFLPLPVVLVVEACLLLALVAVAITASRPREVGGRGLVMAPEHGLEP